MPDVLASALQAPGLGWILAAAFIAGLVRGFSGFGTGMVFLPVAGQFLTPFEALAVTITMDAFGPIPNIPNAIKNSKTDDVLRLSVGLILGAPVGVLVLGAIAPEYFRYGVSIIALVTLIILISGLRYRGVLTKKMVFGTGFFAGLMEGTVGMPGPPVILLYMASDNPIRVIRATIMLFLFGSVFVLFGTLVAFGQFPWAVLGLGLFATVPYLMANVLGAAMFRPELERVYRSVAYVIIAVSAVSGLPLFD
ncbi:MAG: sulfite exporter TauE/SafE family protein [Marinosulfonomonas sp.]